MPGWLIAECESAELAQHLISQTYAKQGIGGGQLTLHAYRGGPMIADSLAGLLAKLGVEPTHARPHVPDDNPYSEAQFKTLRYRPVFPELFGSQADGPGWAQGFFHWYNAEHYHSALGLMPPAMVHYGLAPAVLAERQQSLEAADMAHPERFLKGLPQARRSPETVWINRPQPLLELAPASDVSAHGRMTPGALLSSASSLPATILADPNVAEVVCLYGAAQRPQGACILIADNASTTKHLEIKLLRELSKKYWITPSHGNWSKT